MDSGDWPCLRYAIAETPDLLRANAERIRSLLNAGAEEPQPLKQALQAIEKTLVALDDVRVHDGRPCA